MTRVAARAAGLTLAAFVIAAVLDYAFVTSMSWILSPREFGALGVALTWFLLLSFFVASGFPMSLAKFVAQDAEVPPGLIRYALQANVLVAVCVSALFLGLTFYGPLSPGPGYGRLVWVIALALILLSVGGTLQFALQGRMAFSSFALLHASKSLNKLLVGVALVAMGLGVAGALTGLVVGGAVLCIGSWALLRISSPHALAPGELRPEVKRAFLRYTLSVFAGSIALTLLMSIDVLGLKYLASGADADLAVARYQAATIMTKAPLWGVLAGLSILFPIMSRLSRSDPAAATRLLQQVLRWTALVLAPAVALLAIFPARVLGLMFPAAYADVVPVLVISVVGMASLATCLVITRALQATDRARAAGAYLVVSVAIQAALLIAFVPRWGALGAAAATAIAAFSGASLAVVTAGRAFRLRVSARDGVALAVSVALLSAVVAAVPIGGRVITILAFAGGGVAYVASIFGLGLVRDHERRAIIRRVLPGGQAVEPEAARQEG